jgi:ABC-2 type transport system permease protein
MIILLRKMKAFFCRDLLSEATYKIAFIMQMVGMLVSVLTYFFLSRLMADIGTHHLEAYGGNYFAFVLIGIAFISYLNFSITGLSGIIRRGQMLGTLEAILVTPTSIPTVIFSSSLYGFFWATVNVIIYLIFGSLFFGLDLGHANLTAAFTILLLTIISSTGLGIVSASFIMMLKRGDPVGWLFVQLSGLCKAWVQINGFP